MLRVSDSVARYVPRLTVRTVLSSPQLHKVDTPKVGFRSSIPRLRIPAPTLRRSPYEKPTHDSGPERLAMPYSVVDFHHLLHTGLCRRFCNSKYELSTGVGAAIHCLCSYNIVHIWYCHPNIAVEVRGIPNLHDIQSTMSQAVGLCSRSKVQIWNSCVYTRRP